MTTVIAFGDDDDQEPSDLDKVAAELGGESDQKAANALSRRSVDAAVAMKIAGADYSEIARLLDYATPASARIAVERAIATTGASADKTVMRQEISLTLDRYLRSIFTKAINPNEPDQLAYLGMALKITDRKARLHGVDAPQIHFINPASDELNEYVTTVLALAGKLPAVEGDPFGDDPDIIDAEEVDDSHAEG